MKWIEVQTDEELSKAAAAIILKQVRNKPTSVLGLATGSTPMGTYEKLIEDHRQNGTSYAQVTTFNLDEYVGLAGTHPNSYQYYMDYQLFRSIDIRAEHTHIPNGMAQQPEEECLRYEQQLLDCGGIDLQILGIGSNGHIGFNEPGTPFSSVTHVVNLEETTRKANARFFKDEGEVPKQAITMGISSILRSKEIFLLASGEGKCEAMKQLRSAQITENFPASALHLHPNVTVIVAT